MATLDRLGFALALASTLCLTSCSSGDGDEDMGDTESAEPAPSDPGDPTAITDPGVQLQLHALASDIAKQLGVDHPSSMTAVGVADHAIAEAAISGAELEEHDPVFVVQISGGTFTALRHPPGQAAPTGNVLTVTYDAKTLQVLDVGLDGKAPDLAPLGQRVDLAAVTAPPI